MFNGRLNRVMLLSDVLLLRERESQVCHHAHPSLRHAVDAGQKNRFLATRIRFFKQLLKIADAKPSFHGLPQHIDARGSFQVRGSLQIFLYLSVDLVYLLRLETEFTYFFQNFAYHIPCPPF
jgi:hypothetical protein